MRMSLLIPPKKISKIFRPLKDWKTLGRGADNDGTLDRGVFSDTMTLVLHFDLATHWERKSHIWRYSSLPIGNFLVIRYAHPGSSWVKHRDGGPAPIFTYAESARARVNLRV